MWDTLKLGTVQTAVTTAAHWHKSDPQPSKGEIGVVAESAFPMRLETISEQPRVFHIPNCLSIDETDRIIEIASKRLEPSSVLGEDGEYLL